MKTIISTVIASSSTTIKVGLPLQIGLLPLLLLLLLQSYGLDYTEVTE